MREGWNNYSFESCLEAVPKTKKIPTSAYLEVGSFPIVSQEDGQISGYWNESNDVLHILHPVVIFGDHTRVLKYIDFDFVIGADGVKVLSPKSYLIPKFLYYYLRWCKIPSLGYSRHYKLLKDLSVPVPIIEEQERIVAELDLLTGIIDKQKTQLAELDTLAQSIFYDMFGDPVENEKGWEMKDVIDIVKMQRGYDLPVQKRQSNGAIPVYGSNGMIGYHNTAMAKYGVITGRSGTLGKVYVSSIPFFPLNTTLFSVDTHGNNVVYLKFLLENYNLARFGTGTGVPTLNRNEFHNKKIIAVPLIIQQAFAEKITVIESQKASINRSIAETQKLFDYAMDKYFG